MKKLLLALALFLAMPCALFANSSNTNTETKNKDDMEDKFPDLVPEPYEPSEYPSWIKKTRRAAVVFSGSYPLSVFFTKLGFDFYDWGTHDFNSDYSPSIFGGGGSKSRGKGMDKSEIKRVTLTALGVSCAVTLADFIIQEIKESKRAKAADKKWKK